MAHLDHLHQETKILPVKSHSELLAKQYWLSCYQSHHPSHHLTSQPTPARNMKGMLSKFDRDVVPLCDDGISKFEQYCSALRNLHSQAVVDAWSNFVPNRVLGTTPPELSSFECYLSRSIHITLAQLHSGHCRLLNSYKARITARVMFAQTVEWHHTPLNICSSALHARHNWQPKIYGTIQMRWLIFSSLTTTNEGEEL